MNPVTVGFAITVLIVIIIGLSITVAILLAVIVQLAKPAPHVTSQPEIGDDAIAMTRGWTDDDETWLRSLKDGEQR